MGPPASRTVNATGLSLSCTFLVDEDRVLERVHVAPFGFGLVRTADAHPESSALARYEVWRRLLSKLPCRACAISCSVRFDMPVLGPGQASVLAGISWVDQLGLFKFHSPAPAHMHGHAVG